VRSKVVFVLPDHDRLEQLVHLVDEGELHVEVTRRIPLTELPALHADAGAGPVPGKVVVLPE
jgi:NADPH:quinone reductase-like Zn-dependent oxidoreductase